VVVRFRVATFFMMVKLRLGIAGTDSPLIVAAQLLAILPLPNRY